MYTSFKFKILLIFSIEILESKIFERCEFVNILIDTNFVYHEDIAGWACVATWASGLNSSMNSEVIDGWRRYGILQIDDYYGCADAEFSWCHLPCEALLNEDLRDDIMCAITMFYFIGDFGFEGWPEWNMYCEGHDLSPYVDGCLEEHFPGIEPPQTTILKRGGIDERITCNVTGHDHFLKTFWVYNETKYSLAYTVLETPNTPDSNWRLNHLIFPIVHFIEDDVFICNATNDYASVNQTFQMQVAQLPKIISETWIQVRLTHENQSMSCNATGYPAPHLKWVYNETRFQNLTSNTDQQLLDSTTISLNFPKITFEVAEFICEASNRHGTVRKTFRVTIKEPPKITIPSNSTFDVGDTNKSILCSAMGYPLPSLEWKFNRTEFPNLLIVPGRDEQVSYKTSLQLIFPVVPNFGKDSFVCSASNMYSTDLKIFDVTAIQHVQTEIPNYSMIIPIAVVAVGIIITLSFILYHKYLLNDYHLTDEEVKIFRYGVPSKLQKYLYQSSNNQALAADIFRYFPYDKRYELKKVDLSIKIANVLGNGNFGVVFAGEYRGKKVAVKVPKGEPNKIANIKSLLTEIKVMIHIGQHQHVVSLVGAVTTGLKTGELYVAVDYCELGDLETFIRNKKQYFEDLSLPVDYISGGVLASEEAKTETITYLDLLRWSSQIASGMAHLEKMKIIHGDLACRNILLYSKKMAKVSDFGLSKKLYSQLEYVSSGESQILPWRWMAIESLTSFSFCSKSDVWSFGVTLWEIFSLGEIPYPGLSWSQEFPVLLKDGMRLKKPKFATEEVYETMVSCWKFNSKSRPDFFSLFETLLCLKHDLEYPSWRINVVREESESD